MWQTIAQRGRLKTAEIRLEEMTHAHVVRAKNIKIVAESKNNSNNIQKLVINK